MCFGGVIYNLQKRQAVDCQYLQCLKEQSLRGSSVAVCDLGRGYQICTQVMGEFAELPYARTFKNILGNINNIVVNAPTIALRFASAQACQAVSNRQQDLLNKALTSQLRVFNGLCPNWPLVACRVKESFLSMMDMQRQSQQGLLGINAAEAKRNLEICQQAAPPKQRSAGTLDIAQMFNYAARFGAYARDVQNMRISDQIPIGEEYYRVYRQLNPSETLSDIPNAVRVEALKLEQKGNDVIGKMTKDDKVVDVVFRNAKIDDVQKILQSDKLMEAAKYGYAFKDIKEINGRITTAQEQAEQYLKLRETFKEYYDPAKAKPALVTAEGAVKAAEKAVTEAKDAKTASEIKTAEENLKATQKELTAQKQRAALAETVSKSGATPGQIEAALVDIDKQMTALVASGEMVFDANGDVSPISGEIYYKYQSLHTNYLALRNAQAAARLQGAQNLANSIGTLSDYAAKWAYDKGALKFLRLSGTFNRLDPRVPE
jgi:hypothetical protein